MSYLRRPFLSQSFTVCNLYVQFTKTHGITELKRTEESKTGFIYKWQLEMQAMDKYIAE